jgi:hypothetical protein
MKFQDNKTLRQQAISQAAQADTAHGLSMVSVLSILFAWFASAVASIIDNETKKLPKGCKVSDAEKALFAPFGKAIGTTQLRFAFAAIRAKLAGSASDALLYVIGNVKRTGKGANKGKAVFTIGRLNAGLWGQWFKKSTSALRVVGKGKAKRLQVNLHADWQNEQDWHDWDAVSTDAIEAVYTSKGTAGKTKEQRNKERKASEAVVYVVGVVSDALDALKGKGGSRAAKLRKGLQAIMAEFGTEPEAEKAKGKAKQTMRKQAKRQARKAKAGRVRDKQPAEAVNDDAAKVEQAAQAS